MFLARFLAMGSNGELSKCWEWTFAVCADLIKGARTETQSEGTSAHAHQGVAYYNQEVSLWRR